MLSIITCAVSLKNLNPHDLSQEFVSLTIEGLAIDCINRKFSDGTLRLYVAP